MRGKKNRSITYFCIVTLCLLVGVSLEAQQRVNIGAVTKFTGGRAAASEVKDSELYLSTLETQAASQFITFGNINYLDRSSVQQVFHELHLSSSSAFDSSSGALRGLLGRLDVLIVIDASSSDLARLRAIDTETGAVRDVAICKRSHSFFGSPSDGNEDCVRAFAGKLQPSVKEVIAAKQRRTADAAAQRIADEAARRQQNQEKALEGQKALEQQAEAQRAVDREAELQAQKAKEFREQMQGVEPDWDLAKARLSAANNFWNGTRQQMAARGQSLRSEIQTSLGVTNSTGTKCRGLFNTGPVADLQTCIARLNHHLDELDQFK